MESPATPEEMDALLRRHKVVVVDFHASWCGPCRSYSPKFQRLEREMRRAAPDASFAFASVDVDQCQDLARQARVMSVPTTVAWTLGRGFLGGERRKEVLRFSGDRPWPELVREVTAILEGAARA